MVKIDLSINRYLNDLQNADLVILLNPESRQGRIFMITDLGKRSLEIYLIIIYLISIN